MDQVLKQIIADIHPADIAKTGLCYQKLSELPIKQDGKLTYLAGRIVPNAAARRAEKSGDYFCGRSCRRRRRK